MTMDNIFFKILIFFSRFFNSVVIGVIKKCYVTKLRKKHSILVKLKDVNLQNFNCLFKK